MKSAPSSSAALGRTAEQLAENPLAQGADERSDGLWLIDIGAGLASVASPST